MRTTQHASTNWLVFSLALGLLACTAETGGDATVTSDAATSGAADGSGASDGAGAADAGAADSAGGATDTGGSSAPTPPPVPNYSGGGACPKLSAGNNKIWSWGETRKVDVYLPATPKGAPLLFLWHGLGDTKENFGKGMNAQGIASALGAVVLVPQGGLKLTGWGWGTNDDATLDVALFDDLLSCVDQQYDIDNERVWSMGFSAGALWTSWLAMHRSTYLSAAVAWSGGAGDSANKYKKPKRKIPVLLAWGGPQDVAGVKFEEMTKHMGASLKSDGHYVVMCNHNLGHTIPQNGLVWAFDFLKRHPWDVGTSPLLGDAEAQKLYPSYCEFPAK